MMACEKDEPVDIRKREQRLVAVYFRFLPWVLAVLTVSVLLLATNDHLGGADSGEMVATSYNWGIAHPPGYPFYITVGRLFSLLSPFSNVLYTYNLFSSLCYLAALVILYRALRLAEMHPAAICAAGVFFVFSPLNLRWLTTAEVFSPHILLCAAGIYLTLYTIRAAELRPVSRLLGLVVGLGAANHHSLVFLVPGFVLVWGRYWLKLPARRRPVELAWLSAAFLAGISLYLQPVISTLMQEQPVSALGIRVDGFGDLVDLFLRRLYGTLSLSSSSDPDLPAGYWLGRYLSTGVVSRQGLTMITAALAGLGVLMFPFRGRSLRNLVFLAWTAGALSFFLLVDSTPTGDFEGEILSRMYLMPNLTVVLLAASALDWLFSALRVHAGRFGGALPVLAPVVFLSGALMNGIPTIRSGPVDVELQAGRDALDACSRESLLFTDADTNIFATFYLQEVEGYRRDVALVVWPMLKSDMYQDSVIARWGRKLGLAGQADGGEETISVQTDDPGGGFSTSAWLLALLRSGKEIFSTRRIGPLLAGTNVEEPFREQLTVALHGIVWQVYEKKRVPALEDILAVNASLAASYLEWLPKVDYRLEHRTEQLQIEIYREHLKLIRNDQFKMEEQVIPDGVLERLCLYLKRMEPADPLADFYLGLYYTRFKPDPVAAVQYLEQFLEQHRRGERRLAIKAEEILKILRGE